MNLIPAMNRLLKTTASLTALLLSTHLAVAQDPAPLPPLPPNVLVNGSVLAGNGSGAYSTSNYQGASVPASLSVNENGQVSLSASDGYWTPQTVNTPSYFVQNPPYLIAAHWQDVFDDDGVTVIDQTWVDDQWVDPDPLYT